MPEWHHATITDRQAVSRGVYTLSLAVSADLAGAYQRPGQYHRLRLAEESEAHYFAIASAPGASTFDYLLRASSPLTLALESLPLGSSVSVGMPEGPGFPIEATRGADVLLVGIGTAIAPLMAALQVLTTTERAWRTVTLVWGARHEAELALLSNRGHWQREGVSVRVVLSRPPNAWQGLHGRVQDHLGTVGAQTVAFICGHAEMEREVTHRLEALGVEGTKIFRNHSR